MVLILSWFSIVTLKIFKVLFLLIGNDETLWPNLDVVKIGQVVIILLKILNFMVSKYNNLWWHEQNFGVKVHVACQHVCVATHMWIYYNFTLALRVQNK
jgi:hypothetical protein